MKGTKDEDGETWHDIIRKIYSIRKQVISYDAINLEIYQEEKIALQIKTSIELGNSIRRICSI